MEAKITVYMSFDAVGISVDASSGYSHGREPILSFDTLPYRFNVSIRIFQPQ